MYGRQRERERASVGWGTLTRAHAQRDERHVTCWVGRRDNADEWNTAASWILWLCGCWMSGRIHGRIHAVGRDLVFCSSRVVLCGATRNE